jgi:quercetin dioxygenase-like cupin family protein
MADRETAGQALRPSKGGFVSIRIAEEIAKLRAKLDSASGDREAVSLVKDYGLNVMLMVLKQGARIHEHHTKGPLTVQVIAGLVRIVAANSPNEIATGGILALDREIPHSVEAVEESVLLLTTALT